MSNTKTLKPFQKGVDARRNVAGRPRITKLTEAIRRQIAEALPGAPEETIAEQIAKTLIRLAISGDVAAIKEIADRTEGKAKQAIDLDLQINDWRTLAQNYGVSETDVVREAKLLIAESAVDPGGEASN